MTEYLILVGGGGHCRSCLDVIETDGRYRVVGIVDVRENVGRKIAGYEIIGSDDDLRTLATPGISFLITLGQVESPRRRMELFAALEALGASLATIVSPTAHVARTARIGRGTIVMHHALIAAGATVGDNCIVNDKALIEHDAMVGSHCHISTAAVVNGGSSVGAGAFVGSAAVIAHQVEVPARCVIGAGTVVHKSLPGAGTYAGNPFRRLREA